MSISLIGGKGKCAKVAAKNNVSTSTTPAFNVTTITPTTEWILTLEDGTVYRSPIRADLLLLLALEIGYV